MDSVGRRVGGVGGGQVTTGAARPPGPGAGPVHLQVAAVSWTRGRGRR